MTYRASLSTCNHREKIVVVVRKCWFGSYILRRSKSPHEHRPKVVETDSEGNYSLRFFTAKRSVNSDLALSLPEPTDQLREALEDIVVNQLVLFSFIELVCGHPKAELGTEQTSRKRNVIVCKWRWRMILVIELQQLLLQALSSRLDVVLFFCKSTLIFPRVSLSRRQTSPSPSNPGIGSHSIKQRASRTAHHARLIWSMVTAQGYANFQVPPSRTNSTFRPLISLGAPGM